MSFEIRHPGPRVAPEVPSISTQFGRIGSFCRDEIARHGLFGFLSRIVTRPHREESYGFLLVGVVATAAVVGAGVVGYRHWVRRGS